MVAPERAPAVAWVLYPGGECETGWIEVERYDREIRAWRAHAHHPRVRADACRREDVSSLLNELRVRCIDPSGARPPSPWRVGAELQKPLSRDRCAFRPPETKPEDGSTSGGRPE
ncbi:MAG: hypothetical protein MJE66_22260 [Proteobacteria bacterium]|nr:hypothetical protein [Pseudomonadota bacterium]